MKLLMPMAGLASRFNKESDQLIIKPLIDVNGKKMYQLAMHPFLDIIEQKNRIFIIQRSHKQLEQELRSKHPGALLITLDRPTRGPGETLTFATDSLDSSPVIVCDCDLYFESTEFKIFLQGHEKNAETGVLTFHSDMPQYSYVTLKDSMVQDIVEKKVISNSAVCGCYYFSSGSKLKTLLELTNARISDREIYLSDVIKTSLLNGERCRSFACDFHVSLGTPEELKENVGLLPLKHF